MEDIEMKLEDLQQHSEETQLYMLTHEIDHYMEHGIQPSYEWYETRFLKIYAYSELNWEKMADEFRGKSSYITDTAERIRYLLTLLVEEWSTSPVFDLNHYYVMLHYLCDFWKFYEKNYVDEHEDSDVSDLIIGMKHL